jgi:hypothetical protein
MRPETILRWIARVWSIASTLLLLAFVFGGRENLRFTPGEAVGFLLFPVGVVAGFALAWRRELAGGLLTVASLALFAAYMFALSGRWPNAYFLLFAAPGFIHISSALLARRGDQPGPRLAR